MRFVADESCDFAVVRALRSADYDVVAVAEISPRIGDDEVLRLARDGQRVLLTEDKDFGELVYTRGLESCGVILFRFPAGRREAMARAAVDAVNKMHDRLASRFIVVQPGRIRAGASGRNT
jgi:predicted nuclease of predicted toxin-antitoxin system